MRVYFTVLPVRSQTILYRTRSWSGPVCQVSQRALAGPGGQVYQACPECHFDQDVAALVQVML